MKVRSSIWVLVLILCSLPSLVGIFHKGFFVSDDGSWMVIRLSAFYSALTSGQFPVRMLPQLNNGLGYPVADFLYPLFLYIGSLLHVLRIPFLWDIKIILAASMILSGIGSYYFLRKHFSDMPAFFGSLFYVYLPYHLYDIYVRGSVGEVVSLAVAPFLFWSINVSWALAGVFLALLITAHNTLALFFLPVAICYAILQKMSVRQIAGFVFLGLGLSAFFWIPALYDKQFTVFDSIAISNPSAYFVDKLSYLLVGWISVAIFGGLIFVRFSLKERKTIFFTLISLLSLFFSLSISNTLWNSRIFSEFVQFPFRFLSLLLLGEAFLAAYCISKFKSLAPTLLFLLILLFSSAVYLIPTKYDYQPETFYSTNTGTTTVGNEYMPVWAKNLSSVNTQPKVMVNGTNGIVANMQEKGTRLSFNLSLKKKSTVTIAFVYFPGWQVLSDSNPVTVNPSSPEGFVQFPLEKGTHLVQLSFKETPVRLFADAVSLLSLIIVLGVFIKRRYEK